MVTASAIGNADAPKTKIVVETQKRRYPGYDQRDPASVSFAILLFIPVNTLPNLLPSFSAYACGFALRLSRT